MKKFKYKNIPIVVDNIRFDSIAEGKYYKHLKCLESLKKIEIIELQPKIYLTNAKILYKPDFHIFDLVENKRYYIDVKGMKTAVFQIKKRLWAHYTKEELRLVKIKKGLWTFFEIIKGSYDN